MKNRNINDRRTIPTLLIVLVLGCLPLSSAVQAAGRSSIVGLWNVNYLYHGTTEYYQAYDQWHSDGLEFEVAAFPGTVCQGTYKELVDGTIQLFHVEYTFDENGVWNGHWEEKQIDTVSADGTTYSGTWSTRYYDLNGNFLGQLGGTVTATRLPAN